MIIEKIKINNDLFLDHVRLLTGREGDGANIIVTIPPKYNCLFTNDRGDLHVSLNEFGNVVGSILCRRKEYGNENLDKWGRFDHNKDFLVQKEFDQSPIVDELILHVLNQINGAPKSFWPEGKRAAVCFTHDVDSIDGLSFFWLRRMNWYWRWLKAKIAGNQREADRWMSTSKKWIRFKKKNIDPMDSFDHIRELEARYGFRSTFFFMSLRHGLSREGRRYAVQNPRVVQVARELLKDGWEVGLHASYHNHLSLLSLKEQKQRLENTIQAGVIGCRHHYLRVRFPQSWKLYARAGFDYSSNMGWGGGFNGFRAGTCFPFQPLKSEYSLWEIPVQLADWNPIIDSEYYVNTFSSYLTSIKAVGGFLVINFHQENLSEDVAPGVENAYRKILETIANDQEVTVLTMQEVCKLMNRVTKLA
jgi:peptidoglycan/xylan/chitin deacetylase (PgdA/CDA1 family)